MSDEAWIISTAAAASTSFSAFAPADSPAAISRMPRTRLPLEVRARRSGSRNGAGAPVRVATDFRNSSMSVRLVAK